MFKFNKIKKMILCLCVILLLVVGCGKKEEKGLKVVNLVEDNDLTIKELYITDKKELSTNNLIESNLEYNDAVTIKLSSLFELKEDKKINVTIVDEKGQSYIWYDVEINDGNALEMHMNDGMVNAYVVDEKEETVPYNPNTIVLP